MPEYSSDNPLSFPSSPTAHSPRIGHLSRFNWSDDEAPQLALPTSPSNPMPAERFASIMDRQEVEVESEIDDVLEGDLRKAGLTSGLRIKIPGRSKAPETKKKTHSFKDTKPDSCQRKADYSSEPEALTKKVPRQKFREKRRREASAMGTNKLAQKRRRPKQQNGSDNDSDPDSNTTSPPSKRPRSQHQKLDESDDPQSDTVTPVKRPRGRPRKSEEERQALPKRLAVHVYVQITAPPKLVRGKTHRGDKLKPQKPRKEGPFTLTRKYDWQKFLNAIVELVGEDLENLLIEEMVWTFNGKKTELPLTSKAGFKAMMEQLDRPKSSSTQTIIVYLPAPLPSRKQQRRVAMNLTDDEAPDIMTGMWAKKESTDNQLAPMIEMLQDRYPIGICAIHRSIRCYRAPGGNMHFELDHNKLTVWALAISRRNADYEKPPLGSKFFCPQDRITGNGNNVPDQPQTPQPPANSPFSYMYPPPSYAPMPHHYNTFYPPVTPYHTPYSIPPTPHGYPSPNHFRYPPGPIPPQTPGPSSLSGMHPISSQGAGPSTAEFSQMPMQAVSPRQSTATEWCRKHGLGEEERRGLAQLGFRGTGDKLDVLPDDVWQWANLGPLHKQRIMSAYHNDQSTPF